MGDCEVSSLQRPHMWLGTLATLVWECRELWATKFWKSEPPFSPSFLARRWGVVRGGEMEKKEKEKIKIKWEELVKELEEPRTTTKKRKI